jgi:hypothetical protein
MCYMQVLELIREVKEDEEEERNSDISGYHSETDSAIMMTGNSPFVTKNARTNFLQRSGQRRWSLMNSGSQMVGNKV